MALVVGQEGVGTDGGACGTFVSVFAGSSSLQTLSTHVLLLVAAGGRGGSTSFNGHADLFTNMETDTDYGYWAAVAAGGGGEGVDGLAGGTAGASGSTLTNTGLVTDCGAACCGGGFYGNRGIIYDCCSSISTYGEGGGLAFLSSKTGMGGFGNAIGGSSSGVNSSGGAGDNAGGGVGTVVATAAGIHVPLSHCQ